jgi:hypothetical protein
MHLVQKPRVNISLTIDPLPPKDERDKQNQRAEEKAGKIQGMDEHKIPLEELCYRFGTNI